MPNIKNITEKSFKETIEMEDKLVIVEFYTNTCVNCAAVAPTYAKLSDDHKERAVFTKLNANTSPDLVRKFGVMGTPTFKFFCHGRPIGEVVGAINATLLNNQIKDFLRHKQDCLSKITPLPMEIDGLRIGAVISSDLLF